MVLPPAHFLSSLCFLKSIWIWAVREGKVTLLSRYLLENVSLLVFFFSWFQKSACLLYKFKYCCNTMWKWYPLRAGTWRRWPYLYTGDKLLPEARHGGVLSAKAKREHCLSEFLSKLGFPGKIQDTQLNLNFRNTKNNFFKYVPNISWDILIPKLIPCLSEI